MKLSVFDPQWQHIYCTLIDDIISSSEFSNNSESYGFLQAIEIGFLKYNIRIIRNDMSDRTHDDPWKYAILPDGDEYIEFMLRYC